MCVFEKNKCIRLGRYHHILFVLFSIININPDEVYCIDIYKGLKQKPGFEKKKKKSI